MRMIPCGNRGLEVAKTRLPDGKPVRVYECQEYSLCTLEADGLACQGAPLAVCQGCTAWIQPTDPEQRATLACVHRLAVIREEKCQTCGSPAGPKGTVVQISGCALHGECTPSRYKAGQTATACRNCGDFEAAPQ